MQSIIGGEDVSLAAKNKDPVTGPWTVPGMLFGNENANWIDAAGSMTRRLLGFEFPKTVTEVNPRLASLIRKEMPAIIFKSNSAYLDMLEHVGSKGLWECLPRYFLDTQAAMAQSISPLRAFMETCDALIIDEAHYMPFAEFWTMHNDFVRERHYKTPQITKDYYSTVFEKHGVTVMKGEEREWQGKKSRRDWIVGIGPRDQFSIQPSDFAEFSADVDPDQ
jgi:hypothetical protein